MLCILLLSSLFSLAHSQCGGTPASEVNGFLSVHNRLRASVSAGTYVARGRRMPAARVPIPNLVWDCGLERSAQSVANTCVFQHSAWANSLGENLYMAGGTGVSFSGQGQAASNAWESEFQSFGWPGTVMTQQMYDLGIGHATQMVWARSTAMGCGMASCSGGRVIVACHYREAGNYLNQNIYEATGAVGDATAPVKQPQPPTTWGNIPTTGNTWQTTWQNTGNTWGNVQPPSGNTSPNNGNVGGNIAQIFSEISKWINMGSSLGG